jgi:hypothetical protein
VGRDEIGFLKTMYSEFKKLNLLNILWQLFWVFENNVFRVQKAEAIKYFMAVISLCLFFPTLVRASLKYVVPVFHQTLLPSFVYDGTL